MVAPRARTAAPTEALREALARLDAGERVVVATVLRRRGSAPSTPGQKLALFGDGTAVGTIGGGAVEQRTLEAMAQLLTEPGSEPVTVRHELGASMGMCCGGAVELLLEPMDASMRVLIVGAGHVGCALAPILVGLGFRVLVVDAREGAFDARGLASGRNLLTFGLEHDEPEVLEALGDPVHAALLVMTHDHALDQTVIEWALRAGFAFVGGVGSRAKAARTRQRLEAKNFPEGEVARVRMPLGVAVDARTPGEIAVAIAAELVSVRAQHLDRASRKAAP
ncbi:MAG: XdhC family protein [Deltaproteobacteria bacterium]|nr:XdhC family protein [Deltaproteobacteria bacterium]